MDQPGTLRLLCSHISTSSSLTYSSNQTTHQRQSNLINNARFIGDRMNLTPDDVLCCPPPLFHCFGLTLGLLATLTHGGKVVYATEAFDAAATLHAISDEKCTALHGVPAMFETLLSLPRPEGFDCSRLRTGIIAGSPVPKYLMEKLVNELGMTEFTSSYGNSLSCISPLLGKDLADECPRPDRSLADCIQRPHN